MSNVQPVPPPGVNDELEQQIEDHTVQRWAILLAKGVSWLVLAYLVLVQIILFLGFILHLFGADPSSSFVQWAYRNLDSAMRPFRGIFQPIELGTTAGDVEATLETSILFAMIIYGILALAVSALVNWFSDRLLRLDRREAQQRAWLLHQQELQALSDRAAIVRAQQAANVGTAAAAATAATQAAHAAQQTSADMPAPPPPPTTPA